MVRGFWLHETRFLGYMKPEMQNHFGACVILTESQKFHRILRSVNAQALIQDSVNPQELIQEHRDRLRLDQGCS